MKIKLLNIDGTKSDLIECSDKVFNLKVNHKLIKQVIDWQLNHAKPRTAKTKQRNEIRGSTKKIIAQKYLHYSFKEINKKVRKLALAQTLSKKNMDKNLYILNDVKIEVKKTKEFNKFLINNNLSSALFVSDKVSEKNINKSAKNIKNVKIISDAGTNIYDLLKYKDVILTSSSMKKIEDRILNENN